MDEPLAVKTATIKKIAGSEYVVQIAGGSIKIAEGRLDLVIKSTLADDVVRILYTDATDTWIMDLVPFVPGPAAG